MEYAGAESIDFVWRLLSCVDCGGYNNGIGCLDQGSVVGGNKKRDEVMLRVGGEVGVSCGKCTVSCFCVY